MNVAESQTVGVRRAVAFVMAAASVALLYGLVACSSPSAAQDEPTRAVRTDDPKTSPIAREAPSTKFKPHVGDEVDVKGAIVKVTKAKAVRKLKTPLGPVKGSFYVVNVTVENRRKEPLRVSGGNFQLQEADDTVFTAVKGDVNGRPTGFTFPAKSLPPRTEMKGRIVFEVPKDVRPVVLQIRFDKWGFESGEVSLKK